MAQMWMWIYIAMAMAIASVAFLIAQVAPGMGVPFVILTTTAWTAYSNRRGRRAAEREHRKPI